MVLHGVVKFGLYEGTIFGLHFLFSEILMFAFPFKIEDKRIRNIVIALSILILLAQLKYNSQGMIQLIIRLMNWK